MFSGIVEEVGRVESSGSGELKIAAKAVLEGTRLGDSIAVNGACLTVTRLTAKAFSVNVIPETLRRTDLGKAVKGVPVNLERALAYGARVGGHLVQGHVDRTGAIARIDPDGDAIVLRITIPRTLSPFIIEKGFIAVDGVSLTIVGCGTTWFSVTLIPYTRKHTVLGTKAVGDSVNLEVDMMAKYAQRLLGSIIGQRPE